MRGRDESARWRSWVLPGLLAVLLAALLATSVTLLLDRRSAPVTEALRPADVGAPGWADDPAGQAVVAARRAATTYFTLGHRRVEADMDAMRALGTEGYVAAYDVGADELARRIVARRVDLSATPARGGAATEYLAIDRAQVLVAVDVVTVRGAESRTTRYRTRVVLDRVGGDWLVSALDEVR